MTSYSPSGPPPHVTDEKTKVPHGEDACLQPNNPTELQPRGRTKSGTSLPVESLPGARLPFFQGRHRKQLLLFLYEKHVKLGLKDKKWVFFPLVLGFRFSVCFLNLNAHEDSLLNLVLIS